MMATPKLHDQFQDFWQLFRRHSEWFVLPPFLIAAFLLGYMIEKERTQLTELTIRSNAAEIANGLAWRLERSVFEPVVLTRSLTSLAELDIDEFSSGFPRIASELRQRNPGIINIAIAPDLMVTQVFPVEGNEMVLGLDYRTQPNFLEAIERAISDDEVVLTGPVKSLQGPDVFIVRAPVIIDRASSNPETWGIVSVVVLAENVISVIDETADNSDFIFAVQAMDRGNVRTEYFYGTSEIVNHDPLYEQIPVPGGQWRLAIAPRTSWQALSRTLLNNFRSIYFLAVTVGAFSIFMLARLWRQRSEAENLLNTAINTLDQGFVVFDKSDRLLLCNQAYHNYYTRCGDIISAGASFKYIVREGLHRGQFPEAKDNPEGWVADRLYRHAQPSSEAVSQLPDGTWLKISERRTRAGMSVGLHSDVSELLRARKLAEEALQVKSEFISVLSHELRTPLTIILGYAKVLSHVELLKTARELLGREGETSGDIQGLLDQIRMQGKKIQKSGEHLLVLINDLLDYSKIEAGHFELKIDDVSIASLIGDVVEDMSDMAAQKGLNLNYKCRDIIIKIDPIRAKQVFINIIGNAIKFTDSGEIRIRNEILNGSVIVSIEDTGCGIDENHLESVFDAFKQVDFSDKRKAGGTGLGLAICRQIMLMHGGSLHVSSNVGVGSRFTVEFPIEAVEISDDTRRRASRLSHAI